MLLMATIKLSKDGRCAIVDDDLFPFLNRFSWSYQGSSVGYAVTRIQRWHVLMHRLIMNPDLPLVVDHINGNGLDNRVCNLRICTQQMNMVNKHSAPGTSGYRGVIFDRRDGRFCAKIMVDSVAYDFFYSDSAEECARAYDSAARFHFGEFSVTNFHGTEVKSVYEWMARPRTGKNFSGFRGVKPTGKAPGRWQAIFRDKHIGVFGSKEEAARAYDAAAHAGLGRKARLNFPQDRT